MKKIYQVTNCTFCPHSMKMDGKMYCTENKQAKLFKDYREITREDEFILDENNHALRCKFPEWCMLEDYNQ